MGEFREKEGDQTVSEFEKTRHKLTRDSDARKRIPIASGVLDYFPRAIAAIAHVSVLGNEKHNPGQRLHWAKHKSMDQADCIGRHLIERGGFDTDGVRHSAHLAWRALAMLEEEIARAEGTWEQEVRACRDRDPELHPVPPKAAFLIDQDECEKFDGHHYSGGACVYCDKKLDLKDVRKITKPEVRDPEHFIDESEDVKEERHQFGVFIPKG